MYDLFLRMVREEINTSKLIILQRAKFEEYKAFIKNSLTRLYLNDPSTWKYFREAIKRSVKDLDLLARFRMVKKMFRSESVGGSVDEDILGIIDKIIRYYVEVFSGLVVERENKIYALSKTVFSKDSVIYRPGDIVPLSRDEGLQLFISDGVELIKEPYFAPLFK